MEQNYAKLALVPRFSGHYRQRGSGFGALAAGIGRVAIPFERRVNLPAAKKLGREFLMSAAPELFGVGMKKRLPNKHWKKLIQKLQENKSVVVDVFESHQWMYYEEEGQ